MIRTTTAILTFWLFGLGAAFAQTAEKQKPELRVIGYLPDYRLTGNALTQIPRCTDIVFFGSEILEDGTIKLAAKNTLKFAQLQNDCQKSKTKLHLCLGGWKKDIHYPAVTAQPNLRKKVIDELV